MGDSYANAQSLAPILLQASDVSTVESIFARHLRKRIHDSGGTCRMNLGSRDPFPFRHGANERLSRLPDLGIPPRSTDLRQGMLSDHQVCSWPRQARTPLKGFILRRHSKHVFIQAKRHRRATVHAGRLVHASHFRTLRVAVYTPEKDKSNYGLFLLCRHRQSFFVGIEFHHFPRFISICRPSRTNCARPSIVVPMASHARFGFTGLA
jgi:hypothetical protein